TSSRQAAGRRPSKRLRCEKSSRVTSALEGRTCVAPPAPKGEGSRSGRQRVIPPGLSESVAENGGGEEGKERDLSSEPFAVKPSGAPSESSENLQDHGCGEEESSCESVCSEGSSLEDGDIPKKPTELDYSAFLDEDSNQPMPVDRFFGNIDFMQDQLAAVLPSTAMSRREYRRLHFIAKEDEEEEEEDAL
ncbi:CA174 protein, partial [Odontophorus gujanensis]|nr:CA174 protein [Odontophorus gujanensis]